MPEFRYAVRSGRLLGVTPRAPGVPTLTDGVVTLRALNTTDLPSIVEQCRDPESARWLPLRVPYGPADAQAYLDSVVEEWANPDGKRSWAVTDAAGEFCGTVSLRERSARRVEVGFGLHPGARGRGLMSAAVRLVVTDARAQGVQTIRWRARRGNLASLRVAWACGFSRPTVVTAGALDREGMPCDEWHAALESEVPLRPQWLWRSPPTLRGAVVVRPWRANDAPTQSPDALAREFNPGVVPGPHDFVDWLTARQERMIAGTGTSWCIADPDTDTPLGHVQLVGLDPAGHDHAGRLGFWLHPGARGQGHARAALSLVLDHAMTPREHGGLGLARVEARVIDGNLASQRSLYAVGLRREAVLADASMTGSAAVRDEHLLAITASAWAVGSHRARAATTLRGGLIPVIETDRLRLRPWLRDDGPSAADAPDARARRSVPARALPPHEGFEAWLLGRWQRDLDGENAEWCLADRHTDRALGYVCVFGFGCESERFEGELGYLLYPSARGHGFVGEVLPQVIAHAFRPTADGGLGLVRLHGTTTVDNAASQAILRRAGFRQTAVERWAARSIDGQLTDLTRYELLAPDVGS